MTTWLVTRHPESVTWAQAQGIQFDRMVAHIEPEHIADMIAPGDLVYGILPVPLAAAVCERGARYFHLALTLTEDQRGQELLRNDLVRANPHFEEYIVKQCV